MRVQPVFILLLLTALAGRFGFNRAVAAPFLSATNIDWQEFYGRTTNLPPAHQPAEPLTLCLLLHGTENADRTNIQITVSNWLTLHPQAVVVPVCESPAAGNPAAGAKRIYVWVVEAEDVLNVELVRQGCVGPTTQLLIKGDKPRISRADYQRFVQQVEAAGSAAEAARAGIWGRR